MNENIPSEKRQEEGFAYSAGYLLSGLLFIFEIPAILAVGVDWLPVLFFSVALLVGIVNPVSAGVGVAIGLVFHFVWLNRARVLRYDKSKYIKACLVNYAITGLILLFFLEVNGISDAGKIFAAVFFGSISTYASTNRWKKLMKEKRRYQLKEELWNERNQKKSG